MNAQLEEERARRARDKAMYAELRARYTVVEEIAGPKFEVVVDGHEIDPAKTKMGRSMKGVYEMAVALGWICRLRTSTIHKFPVLYASDSAEDAKKPYSKGDVRFKARDEVWYCLLGYHPTQRLGFKAFWIAGSFQDSVVYDPVGIPVEFYADYTPSEAAIEYLGEQRAKDRAVQQHMKYNDRTSYLAHTKAMDSKEDLDIWLQDWAMILVKPKEQAA